MIYRQVLLGCKVQGSQAGNCHQGRCSLLCSGRNPESEQVRKRGHWNLVCRDKDSRKTIGKKVHNPLSLRVF